MAVSADQLQGLANMARMLGPLLQSAQGQQTLMAQMLQHIIERGGVEEQVCDARRRCPQYLEWEAKLLVYLRGSADKRTDGWVRWARRQIEEAAGDAIAQTDRQCFIRDL